MPKIKKTVLVDFYDDDYEHVGATVAITTDALDITKPPVPDGAKRFSVRLSELSGTWVQDAGDAKPLVARMPLIKMENMD